LDFTKTIYSKYVEKIRFTLITYHLGSLSWTNLGPLKDYCKYSSTLKIQHLISLPDHQEKKIRCCKPQDSSNSNLSTSSLSSKVLIVEKPPPKNWSGMLKSIIPGRKRTQSREFLIDAEKSIDNFDQLAVGEFFHMRSFEKLSVTSSKNNNSQVYLLAIESEGCDKRYLLFHVILQCHFVDKSV